ncbi:transporter [Piscinibacter sp. Jin2]|uniref:Transporter n=1 Tax=Aquariibacter lacus TaxID=2801332 RepID=A0A9X1BN62_9BURK|nr:transporter [Piscinibacter lacus]MBL0719325.1 transporter [Piscinibacter lacus]
MDRPHPPGLRPLGPATAGLALLLAGVADGAAAQDGPSVTPYRPSVSAPAALSAPGWLEVEVGVQRSRADDPRRRDNLNHALKYAFNADWGLRLQGEAWLRETAADGRRREGLGDSSLMLKHHHGLDDDSALGLELAVKLPTARRGLGSGRRDVGLLGIYSLDFGSDRAWHTDLNLGATRLGRPEDGQGRWQRVWAAGLSRQLDPRWGLTLELSGSQQRGSRSTQLGLLAASYALRPGLAFDVGVSRGLNSVSGGWSVFAGLTFLAGRLDGGSPP